jgi:catechol 2,3-dioxygenase-like lactoylglutathione lyase family enzyme
MKAHFILYVADPKRSAAFYASALGIPPSLDVPGMTEFPLSAHAVLGLMPEAGIRRLLGPAFPPAAGDRGGARAEVYLVVPDAGLAHARALRAGGRELSPVTLRDWGHRVGYLLDPDGHVLAFAEEPGRDPGGALSG